MGLEEHLLHMFRDDFEFNDDATPSHLQGSEGGTTTPAASPVSTIAEQPSAMQASGSDLQPATELSTTHLNTIRNNDTTTTSTSSDTFALEWAEDAQKELKKIPFFVRGKARRNTEAFAQMRGDSAITIDTLYDAKAHYAR